MNATGCCHSAAAESYSYQTKQQQQPLPTHQADTGLPACLPGGASSSSAMLLKDASSSDVAVAPWLNPGQPQR